MELRRWTVYMGRMRDEEIARRVRGIVDQVPLPDFILHYDVVPGDIDGDPAVWIKFAVAAEPRHVGAEIYRRIVEMNALEARVKPEVFRAFDDVMPYFRYHLGEEEAAAS